MASAQDVRDILEIPADAAGTSASASASASAAAAPSGNAVARPRPRVDGISRELYALLGSNAPSLALAPERPGAKSAGKKYNPRVRKEQKARLAHHWSQTPFRNPARQDGLVLSHWSRHPAPAEGEEPREAEEEQGASHLFHSLFFSRL